jgi:hypothetical protein
MKVHPFVSKLSGGGNAANFHFADKSSLLIEPDSEDED